MTQYVDLSHDGTQVVAWFASPQASDHVTHAALADNDPRFLAWQAAAAALAAYTAAIAAGVQIVSSGTASLDGTYAIDDAAQKNISSIASGIASRNRLPGGGATFNYFDASAAAHAFGSADFLNFAAAIEDYVYALASGGAPTQPVTIP